MASNPKNINATPAYKQTIKKVTDTLETYTNINGTPYSNKQVNVTSEETREKGTGRRIKHKRAKSLNPEGEFTRARLLNTIVDKIREQRKGNQTSLQITNEELSELERQVRESSKRYEYSNVLDSVEGIHDSSNLYQDQSQQERYRREQNESAHGYQFLKKSNKHVNASRNIESDKRPRSTSNNKVIFTYTSPNNAAQKKFIGEDKWGQVKQEKKLNSQKMREDYRMERAHERKEQFKSSHYKGEYHNEGQNIKKSFKNDQKILRNDFCPKCLRNCTCPRLKL